MISRWSQIISSSWICSGYLVWCLEDPNGCPFCWWCPCPSWPCWQCYWAWPVRPGWLSTVTMCHWTRKSDLDVFSFVLPKDFFGTLISLISPKNAEAEARDCWIGYRCAWINSRFPLWSHGLCTNGAKGAWSHNSLGKLWIGAYSLYEYVRLGRGCSTRWESHFDIWKVPWRRFLGCVTFFHWHDFVSTWCFASCFPRLTHHVELRRKNTSYPTLIQLFAGTISKVAAFSFMHWCRCFWIKVFSGIAVNCCCELAPKHVPR